MAINFLNSVDLNKNQLLSLRLENLGTDPAVNTSVEGQLYYNTQTFPMEAGLMLVDLLL